MTSAPEGGSLAESHGRGEGVTQSVTWGLLLDRGEAVHRLARRAPGSRDRGGGVGACQLTQPAVHLYAIGHLAGFLESYGPS
jgi:hypothetical protein